MTVIKGPYCFVCGGTNVVKRTEWGVIAYTTGGAINGLVARDVCLDCEAKEKEMREAYMQKMRDTIHE